MTVDLTTAMTPDADGHWDVPVGWGMGRGTFGGLVVGALVAGIERRVADPARAVRAVTAEIFGPVVPGPATVSAHVLRIGSHVTTARAELAQDRGGMLAHAVALLGHTRGGEGATWQTIEPPQLPAWRDVPAAPAMPEASVAPSVAANFEFRVVDGIPMSGATGERARCTGYVRAKDEGAGSRTTAAASTIAALCDAWWPVALARFTRFRPMATIAFTLDLTGDLVGLDPAAPFAYRATSVASRDGYFVETRELWGDDGRLVARNHQTMAIIA
jgi:acyl-CoA thioesterase